MTMQRELDLYNAAKNKLNELIELEVNSYEDYIFDVEYQVKAMGLDIYEVKREIIEVRKNYLFQDFDTDYDIYEINENDIDDIRELQQKIIELLEEGLEKIQL